MDERAFFMPHTHFFQTYILFFYIVYMSKCLNTALEPLVLLGFGI